MISTSIYNIKFDSCIFNAFGPLCTTENELHNIDKSCSSCVVTKTCTLKKEKEILNPDILKMNMDL